MIFMVDRSDNENDVRISVYIPRWLYYKVKKKLLKISEREGRRVTFKEFIVEALDKYTSGGGLINE